MFRERDDDSAARHVLPRDEQQLAVFEQALRRKLFRALCPPSDELIALALRALPPDRFIAAAEHLALCEHCQHELQLFARVMQQQPYLPAARLHHEPPTP